MRTDPLDPDIQRELDAIDAALAGRRVPPDLTELGALAIALREERAEPPRDFAYELDRRVAAGFPDSGRRRLMLKWPKLPSPLVLSGAAASAVAALVITASVLSSGGDGSSDGGMASTSVRAQAPQEQTPDFAGGGSSGGQSAASRATSKAKPKTQALQKDAAPQAQDGASGAATGGGLDGPVAPEATVVPASPTVVTPLPNGSGSVRADSRQARKVERSASVTLAAEPSQIDTVADGIVGVADHLGGFVVTSSVTATDGSSQGGGDFLLRVPSGRLQAALSELSRLAHVRARQQASQDITAQHVSAADRLDTARAERRSLLRRLAKAITDDQVAALKSQLRVVNSRIALAKADLARVDNRAAFSNIAVTLVADSKLGAADKPSDDGSWSPGDAAKDALRILEVASGVLLVALAVALPLGLLGFALVLAARWSTRRSRERALDAV